MDLILNLWSTGSLLLCIEFAAIEMVGQRHRSNKVWFYTNNYVKSLIVTHKQGWKKCDGFIHWVRSELSKKQYQLMGKLIGRRVGYFCQQKRTNWSFFPTKKNWKLKPNLKLNSNFFSSIPSRSLERSFFSPFLLCDNQFWFDLK